MNHAQEAVDWLGKAPVFHREGHLDAAALSIATAQVHATLALAEQTRTANVIAFLEYANGDSYAPLWKVINEALELGDPT